LKHPRRLSPEVLKQLRHNRTRTLNLWIPEDLDDQIRGIAGTDPLLVSWFMEQAMECYLRDHPEDLEVPDADG